MRRDVIATCPVCENELHVTRLHCEQCGTTIDGRFSVGRFGRLTREQLALLESFLRARGNVREMERELGLSYPTVRGRLEALVRALGLAGEPVRGEADPTEQRGDATAVASDDVAAMRREILERLARREIAAEEAAAALRGLGRRAPDAEGTEGA